MKGAIFPLFVISPLIVPSKAPNAIQKRSIIKGLSVLLRTTTPNPATRAHCDPTDKSICPDMIIRVIPSAIIPLIDD